jgi:hypothetical protein
MTEVEITFRAPNWHALREALHQALFNKDSILADFDQPKTDPVMHDPAPLPPEPKKATRAKPSATKAPPPEPEPEIEPEDATPIDMPPLEVLKQTVTVAVRAAQKNGGPKKILELLPDFKAETGLDFVMNSTEAHRAALYGLVKAAGLNV